MERKKISKFERRRSELKLAASLTHMASPNESGNHPYLQQIDIKTLFKENQQIREELDTLKADVKILFDKLALAQ